MNANLPDTKGIRIVRKGIPLVTKGIQIMRKGIRFVTKGIPSLINRIQLKKNLIHVYATSECLKTTSY
jgi:hypothetical protein